MNKSVAFFMMLMNFFTYKKVISQKIPTITNRFKKIEESDHKIIQKLVDVAKIILLDEFEIAAWAILINRFKYD